MRIEKTAYWLNGRELILRNPEEPEAGILLEYLRTVSEETRYLLKEPEEIAFTLEEEKSYIREQNDSPRNILLSGFLDGEHVGNGSILGMAPFRYRHRAVLGIALYQKYTGVGIGTIMVEALLDAAAKAGFEQVELEAAAGNERAVSLYKKLGFEVFGTLPRNMKYKDGTYTDALWMMRRMQGRGSGR